MLADQNLYSPCHQYVSLNIGAQLKWMLADLTEVPFAIKGLSPRISFPHAEPNGFVTRAPSLIQARSHQSFSNGATKPFTRYIQAH
jgi:hypothetical protein